MSSLESLCRHHDQLEAFLEASLLNPASLNLQDLSCQSLLGDAGFRRYHIISLIDESLAANVKDNTSWVLAISPPETEKNQEFVTVAKLLSAHQVKVPEVFGVDFERGYILQENLGGQQLQPLLENADEKALDDWYEQALSQLAQMALIAFEKTMAFPEYDSALLASEMSLMTQWFLPKLLEVELSLDEDQMLKHTFGILADRALAQRQVFVHRDYHCRNLMVKDGALATIDFQDAVRGPITYDLVSILKDCYIELPNDSVMAKLERFYTSMQELEVLNESYSLNDFIKDFHWMGLQRHIKVLGIFARLSIRDNKHAYLNDLPLVVSYVSAAAKLYDETARFSDWFDQKLLPLCKSQSWWKE